MRLSDIMAAAGLESFAEVALVIAFVTFLAITVYVLARRRGRWERAKRLPLEDGRAPGGAARHDADREER